MPVATARRVAAAAESAGFSELWVNGNLPRQAFDIVAATVRESGLRAGIGVISLGVFSVGDIVREVEAQHLPQERLTVGIGARPGHGALAGMSSAVGSLRRHLDCRIAVGAVGDRMKELAARVADTALLNWAPLAELRRSSTLLRMTSPPTRPVFVGAYLRCALMPEGREALQREAKTYGAIPHYARVFARHGIDPSETVITGARLSDLAAKLEVAAGTVDLPIVRALQAAQDLPSIYRLIKASSPQAL